MAYLTRFTRRFDLYEITTRAGCHKLVEMMLDTVVIFFAMHLAMFPLVVACVALFYSSIMLQIYILHSHVTYRRLFCINWKTIEACICGGIAFLYCIVAVLCITPESPVHPISPPFRVIGGAAFASACMYISDSFTAISLGKSRGARIVLWLQDVNGDPVEAMESDFTREERTVSSESTTSEYSTESGSDQQRKFGAEPNFKHKAESIPEIRLRSKLSNILERVKSTTHENAVIRAHVMLEPNSAPEDPNPASEAVFTEPSYASEPLYGHDSNPENHAELILPCNRQLFHDTEQETARETENIPKPSHSPEPAHATELKDASVTEVAHAINSQATQQHEAKNLFETELIQVSEFKLSHQSARGAELKDPSMNENINQPYKYIMESETGSEVIYEQETKSSFDETQIVPELKSSHSPKHAHGIEIKNESVTTIVNTIKSGEINPTPERQASQGAEPMDASMNELINPPLDYKTDFGTGSGVTHELETKPSFETETVPELKPLHSPEMDHKAEYKDASVAEVAYAIESEKRSEAVEEHEAALETELDKDPKLKLSPEPQSSQGADPKGASMNEEINQPYAYITESKTKLAHAIESEERSAIQAIQDHGNRAKFDCGLVQVPYGHNSSLEPQTAQETDPNDPLLADIFNELYELMEYYDSITKSETGSEAILEREANPSFDTEIVPELEHLPSPGSNYGTELKDADATSAIESDERSEAIKEHEAAFESELDQDPKLKSSPEPQSTQRADPKDVSMYEAINQPYERISESETKLLHAIESEERSAIQAVPDHEERAKFENGLVQVPSEHNSSPEPQTAHATDPRDPLLADVFKELSEYSESITQSETGSESILER